MQGRALGWIVLVVWMATGLMGRAQSAAPDERGVWKVWTTHTNSGDHASVVTACRDYGAKTNQDCLAVVIHGLEAWHLLKSGNTNGAIRLLEPMLTAGEGATPLQKAGAEMARCWLTRIDREMVRLALKKFYVREIEFPDALEALKTLKIKRMPPFADRWGKPWSYKRGSQIKGMEKQQYALESARLGRLSDLGKALSLPYAGRISLEPVRVSPISPDTYEFSSPSRKSVLLQEGTDIDGVTIAYIGANIIVLADENHWRIVLKPR